MTKGTLNQVILIGNCAAAPDLHSTAQGTPIATFAIYTNYIRRDSQGNAVEERERHQIAAWGRLGVAAHQHLRKGSRLRVEGRLETRQWHEVEDSQPRYRTQVVAVNILFLDARDERAQPEGDIPDAHLAILEARQDIVEPPASVYEDTPALV